MKNLILINKQIGETPLEALERARVEHSIGSDVPMTYAGRLDPMAEGLLLILAGEECKKKEQYLGLDKEYEVEVLFGFETDTGDLLGGVKGLRGKACPPLPEVAGDGRRGDSVIEKNKIQEILKSLEGKFVQEYPAFSSKTVGGKPLFAMAKSGDLPDELPTKEIEIYKIEFVSQREIGANELFQYIEENISKVKGDFRQLEILEGWKKNLNNQSDLELVKIKVSCSSGTYMRSLAAKIGKEIGAPALAFSIKRLKVGEYVI